MINFIFSAPISSILLVAEFHLENITMKMTYDTVANVSVMRFYITPFYTTSCYLSIQTKEGP